MTSGSFSSGRPSGWDRRCSGRDPIERVGRRMGHLGAASAGTRQLGQRRLERRTNCQARTELRAGIAGAARGHRLGLAGLGDGRVVCAGDGWPDGGHASTSRIAVGEALDVVRWWSPPSRTPAARRAAPGHRGTSRPAAGRRGCRAPAARHGRAGRRARGRRTRSGTCPRARAARPPRRVPAPTRVRAPRHPRQRRAARADRASRRRRWPPGRTAPGWCRCCSPPCRAGCPARAREASSRTRAGPPCPWCGRPSRPGIWRTRSDFAASRPRYGPPYWRAMPSGCPSPTAMSASYSPGGARTASEIGSTTATNRAPAAWARRDASAIGSRIPNAFGWPISTPRDRTLGIGQLALQRRQIGRAVGQRGQLLEGHPAALEVGRGGFQEVAMDGAADQDAVASRGADRHQRRFRGCRSAVVVRGGHHVEAGQLRDQRLVLVDRLQRALADLGLVRRVRGVELASTEDLVDGRRDVVAVGARAEEARQADAVSGGERLQPARQCQLIGRLAEGPGRRARTGAGMSANSASIESMPSAASICWRSAEVCGPYVIRSVGPAQPASISDR